jgi:hypothetical protein
MTELGERVSLSSVPSLDEVASSPEMLVTLPMATLRDLRRRLRRLELDIEEAIG